MTAIWKTYNEEVARYLVGNAGTSCLGGLPPNTGRAPVFYFSHLRTLHSAGQPHGEQQ